MHVSAAAAAAVATNAGTGTALGSCGNGIEERGCCEFDRRSANEAAPYTEDTMENISSVEHYALVTEHFVCRTALADGAR